MTTWEYPYETYIDFKNKLDYPMQEAMKDLLYSTKDIQTGDSDCVSITPTNTRDES